MRYNENDPALARRYGSLILAATAVAATVFSIGLARRSYWAVALPVVLGFGGLLAAAGVLGRLLATTPDEPTDPRPGEQP